MIEIIKVAFSKILLWIARISTDPRDGEELRLQKILLNGSSLLVVVINLVLGSIYLYFGASIIAAIPLLYAAFTFILFLSGIYRRYRFFRDYQLSCGLALPFVIMVLSGGFVNSSAVIIWALISPLASLLLAEPRQARLWWLGYLALMAVSALLQPIIRTDSHLPPLLANTFFALNIALVGSIAFITINYFIGERKRAFRLLRIEEEKAQNLLLNILPREIAEILKAGNRTIADQFEGASILFADLVGFTPLTARLQPVEMVNLLNEIFSHFDTLVEESDLEKIRTIGDNYMVAAGVPRPRPDHAAAIAHLALGMIDYLNHRPPEGDLRIDFRIGINSGPVVGGVIGRKKFVYDVWGDAVNLASRMESQGVPGKIQITQSTYELIQDEFECARRGRIEIKGKGPVETWFLLAEKGKVKTENDRRKALNEARVRHF